MTHTEETSNKHHTTSTYVEPPREEKKEGQETPGRETPKTKNKKYNCCISHFQFYMLQTIPVQSPTTMII